MLKFLIFCFINLFTLTIVGQSNVGYFSYNKIAGQLEISNRINEFQQTYLKHLNDSLLFMQKQVDSCYTQISYNDDGASVDALLSLINKKVKNIEIYKDDALTRYRRQQKQMQEHLKEKIMLAVQQFSSERNINCLADSLAFLYSQNCPNYTTDLIKYINSQQK